MGNRFWLRLTQGPPQESSPFRPVAPRRTRPFSLSHAPGGVNSGTVTRIMSFRASGGATERPLFTVTSTVWYLDAGPEGSVYASMLDRPSDLGTFPVDGTRFERLASFQLVPENADIMTIL